MKEDSQLVFPLEFLEKEKGEVALDIFLGTERVLEPRPEMRGLLSVIITQLAVRYLITLAD